MQFTDVFTGQVERKESHRMPSRILHPMCRESSRDYGKEAAVEQWTHSDVVKWLTDHKLEQFIDRFGSQGFIVSLCLHC